MDCVVLGAGPTGLVAAYLLEADVVVAERFGGSDIRTFAPVFLRRTRATETLLDELGIPAEPVAVRLGFLGDDGAKGEVGESEATEYLRRARGLDPGAPVEVPTSISLETEVATFDVGVDDLVDALRHHVEAIVGEVRVVEVRRTDGRTVPRVRVAVSGGRELWTRQLVNTLPAPTFDAVRRHEDAWNRAATRDWPAPETTFVRVPIAAVSGELRRARDELGLSVLRVVSPDRARYAYDRVTFVGGAAVLEFNRPESVPTGGDWGALERVSGRFSPLGPSRDPVEYAGTVWHLGRLARWSRSISIADVVEDLYEYRDGGSKWR
jgi:hypothetical protein